jgi:nucleotide-binding universal stress UspA family protein
MSFKKILVGVNNSPLGSHVVAAALELAQFNQAAIRLLHCITTEIVGEPTVPLPLDMGLQPSLTLGDYETQKVLVEKQIEEAQAILTRYREEAIARGLPTEADYQIGEPGHLICEVAKDWGAELVVVGRRGRTGLAEVLLGSVSNYVVHHAPCSVLVIQALETQAPATADSGLLSVEMNPALSHEGNG